MYNFLMLFSYHPFSLIYLLRNEKAVLGCDNTGNSRTSLELEAQKNLSYSESYYYCCSANDPPLHCITLLHIN